MKVIFLDLDGVLLPLPENNDWEEYPRPSEEAVKNLNIVTQLTGAKIVVSSAWKEDRTLQQLKDQLLAWGVRGEVVGVTPTIEDHDCDLDRGEEITSWIEAHDCVGSFVVVDDEPTDLEDLAKFRVMPSSHVGIQWHDAVEAMRILDYDHRGRTDAARSQTADPTN